MKRKPAEQTPLLSGDQQVSKQGQKKPGLTIRELMANPAPMIDCECNGWACGDEASTRASLTGQHHPNCPKGQRPEA